MRERSTASPARRTALRLRPLRLDDEAVVRAGHEAMRADRFPFALGLDEADSWGGYVAGLERQARGVEVPAGRVPATFLVAEADGEIVGRSSIRHELNDFLRREGGHIGYGVLAGHRRRGHATEILRQSLVIARQVGVRDVLVICDEANLGSRAVIERCGGRLDAVVTGEAGTPLRHYWFGGGS
jgi:predicted acetyltransferase